VLAGELVGGVDLDVAARAQRGLVGAAHHRGSRALASVALDLHGRRPTSQSTSYPVSPHSAKDETKKIRPLTVVEDEGEKRPARERREIQRAGRVAHISRLREHATRAISELPGGRACGGGLAGETCGQRLPARLPPVHCSYAGITLGRADFDLM
jgi:hypothetical protein